MFKKEVSKILKKLWQNNKQWFKPVYVHYKLQMHSTSVLKFQHVFSNTGDGTLRRVETCAERARLKSNNHTTLKVCRKHIKIVAKPFMQFWNFSTMVNVFYMGRVHVACRNLCRESLLWCCAPSAQISRANFAHNFSENLKCLPPFVLQENPKGLRHS